MSIYFLGIDPSATCTGLSIVDSSGAALRVKAIEPKKLRDSERLAYIQAQLNEFIADTPIAGCVMETPSYGSTHKEFILGEVLGVIKLTLHSHGIKLVGAAPTQLKKFMTGSGSANKSKMVEEAQLTGCPSDKEDICDSWAAALVCCSVFSGLPQHLTTRPRLEVATLLRQ